MSLEFLTSVAVLRNAIIVHRTVNTDPMYNDEDRALARSDLQEAWYSFIYTSASFILSARQDKMREIIAHLYRRATKL